jgi:phosphate:Na+ symporter
MTPSEIAFVAAQVFGGLALFIFGMKVMSDGLQQAAGTRLRDLLYQLTRNRLAGGGVGSVMGFLVHSSAATVMLVGFVNAGLMSLSQSVPVMLGANVGTTLSMQIVSFKLDEYCWFAIAVGFLLQIGGRREGLKHAGSVLFGFGLLFLGMQTMSLGVAPLKGGPLEAVLQRADAATFGGMLLGLLISTCFTGIIQSSGATVGVLFALSTAGVFTEFRQVMPLLLGAHMGTCATALLGSIGTGIEARRVAIAHLLFNVLGSVAAISMTSFYLWLIPRTADDLVRQIANAHTIIQSVNALIVLPLVIPFARLVERVSPSRARPRERSHLRESCIETPETALLAVLRETQRMARFVREELAGSVRSLVEGAAQMPPGLRRTEEAVNTLKVAISDYLMRIAGRRLSKRQSILVQHLLNSVADLERIGDHAMSIAETGVERRNRNIWFADDSVRGWLAAYRGARHVLHLTWSSLEPQLSKAERRALATEVIEARREYSELSERVTEEHRQLVRSKEVAPLTGVYFGRLITCLDKTVEHSWSIAELELEPVFFVKERKLLKASEEFAPLGIPENGFDVEIDDTLFDVKE